MMLNYFDQPGFFICASTTWHCDFACKVVVYGKSRTQDTPQVLHYLLDVMLKMNLEEVIYIFCQIYKSASIYKSY